MATYTKFEVFIEDLFNKEHDLFGTAGATADTLKVYLSNTAPNVATHGVKADLAEIATGNGYSGAVSCANVGSRASGTFTLVGTSLTITASGGSVGPFRYVVLFNDTHASDGLVAYWDYGSSITLADGESISLKFNNAAVGAAGTIATAA
jgi:hypothetical protein